MKKKKINKKFREKLETILIENEDWVISDKPKICIGLIVEKIIKLIEEKSSNSRDEETNNKSK
jgi:hypothetical protein